MQFWELKWGFGSWNGILEAGCWERALLRFTYATGDDWVNCCHLQALFWQQQSYYGVDLTPLRDTAFQGYFSQVRLISEVHSQIVSWESLYTCYVCHFTPSLPFSALSKERLKALDSKVRWYVLEKIKNVFSFFCCEVLVYELVSFSCVCAACGRCIWSKIADCTTYRPQHWLPNCEGAQMFSFLLFHEFWPGQYFY